MSSAEIRKKFLEFFKKRGHKIVPSSSLIPDDPSVLLTTAGMQQFKKYYTGGADPIKAFGSKNTASIQKSFRTSDIDEVGDETHDTFFEMMGHFSFGDYFKKETIEWTYELLTEVFKIAPERISATVFAGDEKIPFDAESHEAWSRFLPPERIRKGPRSDNVWGPAGPEGPCGAANEVYANNLEIATLVFMEYFCAKDQSLTPLPQKGVDVGWGLERLAMVSQGKKNIFETDLFAPFIEMLPEEVPERQKRIITDHLRGIAFLLADGVRPSNKEAGYVLRRLMRRILVYENIYKISSHVFDAILHDLIHEYGEFYPELLKNTKNIQQEFQRERKLSSVIDENTDKFLNKKTRLLESISQLKKEKDKKAIIKEDSKETVYDSKKTLEAEIISGKEAFNLHQSKGASLESIVQKAQQLGLKVDEKGFWEEFKKHQEISRAGQEKKFGGHGLLLDTGEIRAKDEEELKKVTRLHTATHLLQAALRKVLGPEVKQTGSDITAERTRFDFTFPRKLTPEELKKIEDSVNEAISRELPVTMEEMSFEEASRAGALHFFREKYPERVKVYSIDGFSKELCGGPHVQNTQEVGKFVIIKEEAVAAGVRRIRAALQ